MVTDLAQNVSHIGHVFKRASNNCVIPELFGLTRFSKKMASGGFITASGFIARMQLRDLPSPLRSFGPMTEREISQPASGSFIDSDAAYASRRTGWLAIPMSARQKIPITQKRV